MPDTKRTAVVNEEGDIVAVVTVAGRAPVEIARNLGTIDTDNLAGEIAQTGGFSVYLGVLAAEAFAAQRRAKLHVEVVKATLGRRFRADAARDSEKVTERIIEEKIILSSEYQQAETAHIDAELSANVVRATHTSIDQKQRTLSALGGQVAREMEAGRAPFAGLTSREQIRESIQQSDAPRGGRRQAAQ